MFEPDVRLYVQPLSNEVDGAGPSGSTLVFDAYMADGALKLEFDAPGISRDRLRVRVESHVLVIEAEREMAPSARIDPLITGRPHGTSRSRVLLGYHCDVERVEASLADGVLSISVPLAPSAAPRHVPVRDGKLPRQQSKLAPDFELAVSDAITSAA